MSRAYPEWIEIQRYLNLDADGIPGRKTLNAVSIKLGTQASWQAVQRQLGLDVDGIPGPMTASLVADKLGIEQVGKMNTGEGAAWPVQAEVPRFFGEPGSNLVSVKLPYEMKLAWDVKTKVNSMTMHRLVARATERIYAKVLAHYGLDRIRELGLDLHGGSYNRRRVVGGKGWSMHAYGIAIDIDPENNQLNWGRDKAKLARPEYEEFWKIVESEGAVSLGRQRNYDWMHFQFARLGTRS